jgi:hypothetical protein
VRVARSSSAPLGDERDDLPFDIDTGGSLDQEISERAVLAWQEDGAVEAVVVERHRAKSRAVRLLPSAKLWARATTDGEAAPCGAVRGGEVQVAAPGEYERRTVGRQTRFGVVGAAV